MLHHVSFTAKDPKRVATVLAELIDGQVSRFGPWDGGYVAWARDAGGTAIEVYPHGTEMVPAEGSGQAQFQKNYFASKGTATHAAVSVRRTEEQILRMAAEQGWQAAMQNRGGFEVIEVWVEGTVMLEVMTQPMLRKYLSVIKVPQVAARGTDVSQLQFKAEINADPAEVFESWTSGEALQQWWPIPSSRIDLRIGGDYELIFLPDGQPGARGSEGCRILSYVPNQMVSFTWNSPSHLGLRDAQTWVVIELAATESGTELTLTHCGFLDGEQWDQNRKYFQQAWRRVLRRLVSFWDQEVDLRVGHEAETGIPAQPQKAAHTQSSATFANLTRLN